MKQRKKMRIFVATELKHLNKEYAIKIDIDNFAAYLNDS